MNKFSPYYEKHTKPNYQLKSILIDSGLTATANKIRRMQYKYLYFENYHHKQYFDNINCIIKINFGDSLEYLKECDKINHATYQRKIRLEKRILGMLSCGKCYFLTLTFTDYVLNNTTQKQRREYVSKWLKKNYNQYVANIDFGGNYIYIDDNGVERKATNREHYHAVVLYENSVDYRSFIIKKRINRVNSEYIVWNNNTDNKLGQYLAKLTNHAIKESTKRCCYIYSR